MKRRATGLTGLTCLLFLSVSAAGCTGGDKPPESSGSVEGAPPGAATHSQAASGQVAVEFRSEPDPPRSGDNAIEVVVRQPDGSPVTDATVTAVFSMPAMPSMNMPAMRSEATLAHQASGRYRGTGQLAMDGTWNVTVTVSRGSEELASKQLSVVAR